MTELTVEQKIQLARQARLAKQLELSMDRKKRDEMILGVEVTEVDEEENYTVTTDEDGEIEVIQKDNERPAE